MPAASLTVAQLAAEVSHMYKCSFVVHIHLLSLFSRERLMLCCFLQHCGRSLKLWLQVPSCLALFCCFVPATLTSRPSRSSVLDLHLISMFQRRRRHVWLGACQHGAIDELRLVCPAVCPTLMNQHAADLLAVRNSSNRIMMIQHLKPQIDLDSQRRSLMVAVPVVLVSWYTQ